MPLFWGGQLFGAMLFELLTYSECGRRLNDRTVHAEL